MRPHIMVNLAMSADGKISTRERRQVRISGKEDYSRVDSLKTETDAIMVGVGTVLADNPSLTVKSEESRKKRSMRGQEENPVRVVVDSLGRTPTNADILCKGPGRRIIAVSSRAPDERVSALKNLAQVFVLGDERVDLALLMDHLGREGICSVMVEGGGTLIWSLFDNGLVDEIFTCVGNIIIGGKDAPTPADGEGFVQENNFPRLELIGLSRIDGGALLRWKVKKDKGE